MDNTFVTFEGQYWIYGGDLPAKEKGLTFGGFKSEFFANLVAAYLPKSSEKILEESLFNKIYIDEISVLKTESSPLTKCLTGSTTSKPP